MYVKKIMLFIFCAIPVITHAASCPTGAVIRAVQFTQADIYDNGDHIWELNTKPFSYADRQWTLSYGLYLPAGTSAQEALERGRQEYQTVALSNLNPLPVPIPDHWLCDYTDGGMPWVQAITTA